MTSMIASPGAAVERGAEVVDAEIVSDGPGEAARAMIEGLLNLAAIVEANPALVDDEGPLRYTFDRVLASVSKREHVAALTRAAVRAGVRVTKHQNDTWAGVDIHLSSNAPRYGEGQVLLHVYVNREEICERIVTGTREVSEEVPDPEALAAVPKVTVTKTVEDVEWRCHPILAAELPAGAR